MPSKKLAMSVLGLLVIEFILGMLSNLYAKIPETDPGQVFHQFGWINIHSGVAVLLLLVSGAFIYQAKRAGTFFMPAVWGFVDILLAAVFGHIFVATDNDVFSLLMALAFIGAIITYTRVVFSMPAKNAN